MNWKYEKIAVALKIVEKKLKKKVARGCFFGKIVIDSSTKDYGTKTIHTTDVWTIQFLEILQNNKRYQSHIK